MRGCIGRGAALRSVARVRKHAFVALLAGVVVLIAPASAGAGASTAGQGAAEGFPAAWLSPLETLQPFDTFTVSANVVGSGSVVVADATNPCGPGATTCQVSTGDSGVTITETPSAGWTFAGWSGGTCSGLTNPCVLDGITAGETDTATFTANTFTVSAGVTGSGSVVVADTTHPCGANATTCQVTTGDSGVKITANPSSGWTFTGWSGGSCSGTTNPCTLDGITTGEADTATFAAGSFTVTAHVAASGHGTALVNDQTTSCAATSCTVTTGDVVSVTATANTGYHLSGWSGGTCSGTTNPCPLTGITSAETDTATFAISSFTVTGAVAGSGGGSVVATDPGGSCGGASCTSNYLDTVTLTETPNAGSRFTGWTGPSCAGVVLTHCSVTVTGPETDTAQYVARFNVSGAVSAAGGGSVAASDPSGSASCAGASCTVDEGDTVTLTAAPAAGYRFAGWVSGACTANPCSVAGVAATQSDTASFVLAGLGAPSAAVFVSPSGNDGNAGTQAAPVRSPNRALAILAASGGAKQQLWLAQGSYPGPVTLVSADHAIGIFGGFDPATWVDSTTPAAPTTITGSPEAVIATGSTGTLIQGVALDGQATAGPSSSAYGLVALAGSQVTLAGVTVLAGNATAGSPGSPGAAGAKGGAGGAGGSGGTPAQVVSRCIASRGVRCVALDGTGGKAGLGANGNDETLLGDPLYTKNPLDARASSRAAARCGGAVRR